MKNKFLIPVLLVSVSLLTFSCTTDDYEMPETTNNQLKVVPTNELKTLKEINAQVKDSVIVSPEDDGDPIIVIPPRKI
ncbi:hypothetical protein [Flavobacterium sp.]|uniref:hypothetical protein n=1 Tax=Flavobacterium sp. TaxID=239 RepID=UPI00374D507C